MSTAYDGDVVAWAAEQAALLRARKWSSLDIEHIAEEIEDVGKSVKRELGSRLAVLLARLLKWKFQPSLRGKSWLATIAVQRKAIGRKLDQSPSLRPLLTDDELLGDAWLDGVKIAIDETGIDEFPHHPLWSIDQVLDPHFLPD